MSTRSALPGPIAIAPVLLFALTVFAIAPPVALACSDAGPRNRECSDGGAVWISCGAHADCPEGQICGAEGMCTCGSACREECDETGCHCCEPADAGTTCFIRFYCETPDAGATEDDAGATSMDGGGMDAGIDGSPAPSGGCSVAAREGAPSGPAAIAAIAALAALVRRRRAAMRSGPRR